MKKLLALTLAVMMLFALTACGSEEPAAAPAAAPASAAPAQAPASEAPAAAAELEFPIVFANLTGVDLYELNMSPTGEENWGENLLDAPLAVDASSEAMVLTLTEDTLVWDIRMADSQGTAFELYELDFAECDADGAVIALHYDATADTASAEWLTLAEVEAMAAQPQALEVPITFYNETGVEIHQLYMSPTGEEAWGDDLLGENALASGDSLEAMMTITDAMQWDILMADSEGTSIPLMGLDISECSTDGIAVLLEYDGSSETGTATLYNAAA